MLRLELLEQGAGFHRAGVGGWVDEVGLGGLRLRGRVG